MCGTRSRVMSPKSRCCRGGGQCRVLSTQGKGVSPSSCGGAGAFQCGQSRDSKGSQSTQLLPRAPLFRPVPSRPALISAPFPPPRFHEASSRHISFVRRLVPTSKGQGLFKSYKKPQHHRHPQSLTLDPRDGPRDGVASLPGRCFSQTGPGHRRWGREPPPRLPRLPSRPAQTHRPSLVG